jgi:hypothetical protein
MTSIKIDELNVPDFEFMHQLTDEELLAINGGFSLNPRKIWHEVKEVVKLGAESVAKGLTNYVIQKAKEKLGKLFY